MLFSKGGLRPFKALSKPLRFKVPGRLCDFIVEFECDHLEGRAAPVGPALEGPPQIAAGGRQEALAWKVVVCFALVLLSHEDGVCRGCSAISSRRIPYKKIVSYLRKVPYKNEFQIVVSLS